MIEILQFSECADNTFPIALSNEMFFNSLKTALACIADHLSEPELIAIDRALRVFRVCSIALFLGILTFSSALFPEFHSSLLPRFSSPTWDILIEKSSLESWYSFRYMVLSTLLLPTIALLGSTYALLPIDSEIRAKIKSKSYPFWLEFAIPILVGAIVVGFWANFRFLVP